MRYLKQTPEIQAPNLNQHLVHRIVVHLANKMKEHYKPEFSFHKYVASKPGASRRRFLKAYNQLLTGTRSLDRISKITAFVKNERYFEAGKSPRLIMGRDPRFNILYARFVARLEEAFFSLPQICNACDYRQSGEKFSKILREDSYMFENDMSKYESTQRHYLLALEFLVYALVTPLEEIEDLKLLFAVKMIKAGHTQEGLKFFFLHCRGSGDMDTGLGNGVINYITTMYFKIVNFCPHKAECRMDGSCCHFDEFAAKGDDSYGNMPRTENVVNTYAYFGLDAKLIIRRDPRLTEFCSGHFVRLKNGTYHYVQKLRKLITSLSTVINPDFVERGWCAHYYRSLGDMYSVLYGEMPIYCDIAKFLQTASGKLRVNKHLVGESYGASTAYFAQQHSVEKIDVSPQTMLDISMVNDMSIPELEALHTFYTTARIDLPSEQQRRCNVKSKKADNMPQLDDNVVKQFDRDVNKDSRGWVKSFGNLLRDPLRTLSQLAANS
jgi:hypothetical protein